MSVASDTLLRGKGIGFSSLFRLCKPNDLSCEDGELIPSPKLPRGEDIGFVRVVQVV